jgi:hypothetical protein
MRQRTFDSFGSQRRVRDDGLSRTVLIPESVTIPEFTNGLRKVDLDASVVDENIVHFLVSPQARLLHFKFDKGIVERVARLVVAHDATFNNGSKSRKDELQVSVRRHRIELADEEYLCRRFYISIWKIARHFKDNSSRLRFFPLDARVNIWPSPCSSGIRGSSVGRGAVLKQRLLVCNSRLD